VKILQHEPICPPNWDREIETRSPPTANGVPTSESTRDEKQKRGKLRKELPLDCKAQL